MVWTVAPPPASSSYSSSSAGNAHSVLGNVRCCSRRSGCDWRPSQFPLKFKQLRLQRGDPGSGDIALPTDSPVRCQKIRHQAVDCALERNRRWVRLVVATPASFRLFQPTGRTATSSGMTKATA